ncbi:hypothetical protein V6N11_072234 [Hibiscus sabdariffa]|uniref:Uncharacterized protein n=1 Tax=Hibiscus sabdariffa TaxID=183260 RepID=A0ABR2U2R6_9ROSI
MIISEKHSYNNSSSRVPVVLLQMLVSPLWVKLLLKQCHATEAETSSFEKAILPALVDVSVEEASSHMAQERIDMS